LISRISPISHFSAHRRKTSSTASEPAKVSSPLASSSSQSAASSTDAILRPTPPTQKVFASPKREATPHHEKRQTKLLQPVSIREPRPKSMFEFVDQRHTHDSHPPRSVTNLQFKNVAPLRTKVRRDGPALLGPVLPDHDTAASTSAVSSPGQLWTPHRSALTRRPYAAIVAGLSEEKSIIGSSPPENSAKGTSFVNTHRESADERVGGAQFSGAMVGASAAESSDEKVSKLWPPSPLSFSVM
jgi:hypothetical protein